MSSSPIGNSPRPVAPAATSSTGGTTATPQNYQSLVDAKLKDMNMGPTRNAAASKAITDDMNKFLQGPDANNPDKFNEAFNASFSKHSTHELLGKMQFDMFLSKMQDRMKELSQDMWS